MITVAKKEFCAALDRCGKIAVQKSTLAALAHVKIVFTDVLQYSATNLSTSIVGKLDAAGKPEAFTVNVDGLATAAKNVIGDTVKLSLAKTGRLTVSGEGKRSFTLSTLSVDEFPKIEHDPAAEKTVVPGSVLRTAIGQVQFAVAGVRDARSGTDCLKLEIKDGLLTAIGANGHALARSTCAVDATGSLLAIIPRGAIPSILGIESDTIGIYVTPNEIGFRTDSYTLIQRATATEYPAVENVIDSTKPGKSSLVSAPSVLESLSAIRGSDSAKNVMLTFSETELNIEGGSDDNDRYAMDTVSAVGHKSQTITMAADYLTGALKGFANASFGFDSPSDMVTISDGGLLVIIMPILK